MWGEDRGPEDVFRSCLTFETAASVKGGEAASLTSGGPSTLHGACKGHQGPLGSGNHWLWQ